MYSTSQATQPFVRQIKSVTNQKIVNAYQQNQQDEDHVLSRVNLRELRDKNRLCEGAIKSIQTKIQFMKNKEQKTVKKVINIKRKLVSLESVRSKTKDVKSQYQDEKRKEEQEKLKKAEFNKLIKDHLKYNKKIVTTLMNHKVNEQAKHFKEKNAKLEILANIQQQNLMEQNVEKANKVRMGHLEAHEKRKMYFLGKLNQFKDIKEEKLRQELRQREKQQQMISELQMKQKILLERLSVSEQFRTKCQEEYQEARSKYKSFYEAARGISRGHRSCNQSRILKQQQQHDKEGKAQIFIS